MITVSQEIIELFHAKGKLHYGEQVSQLDHALQTAALAEQDDQPDTLVVACLLHDIGHLLYAEELSDEDIDQQHESLGADWLQYHFSTAVSEPVRLHVDAKRYICSIDEDYFDTLSPTSKHSLQLQGGLMNVNEVALFETNPWHREAVVLRRYDDSGKISGLKTKRIEDYEKLLTSLS